MAMTTDELTELLHRLLAGWENEVVEFKEAARQFSADKTGEYVSALSNEANLRGVGSGGSSSAFRTVARSSVQPISWMVCSGSHSSTTSISRLTRGSRSASLRGHHRR